MIKSIFAAAVLSLTAVSAAWAWPTLPAVPLHQQIATNVIDIYYRRYGYYARPYVRPYGRYAYGNRYWGHRYYYAPYNWQGIGCVAAGPVWYCP